MVILLLLKKKEISLVRTDDTVTILPCAVFLNFQVLSHPETKKF